MIRYLLVLMNAIIIDAIHFNGGTIAWMPVDPYDNSSLVIISITQSYSWTYPLIRCATDVPISTSGRSNQNSNLTCVTDCTTDGGYSLDPIDILTDCISVNPSLGMMASQRSKNVTLFADAHFYLAYVGTAWRALNHPALSGLQWSILTYIDLRVRPDGFINTPPVANVVSPQYVTVNQTTQINIPVSDVNAGDYVRCRWSVYMPGYRRRRSFSEEHVAQLDQPGVQSQESLLSRRIRGASNATVASTSTLSSGFSTDTTTTTMTTNTVTTSSTGNITEITDAFTIGTDTIMTTTTTTTVDTPGTLKSTSSYPNRQAIDECGDICYPSSVPSGTTLSNCTLSFTGLIPDAWYAIAIQVEDFINSTSVTPMSSVPVQFLIYVLPPPTCSIPPVITPLSGCLEVTVNVSMSFNISAHNLCNPNISNITDIVVTTAITGMDTSNLTQLITNPLLYHMTFTWTPEENQTGLQQLCIIAVTDEGIQSNQYCVTFNVITSIHVCESTTSTSTSSTSATTKTTSTTSSTTATTSTRTTRTTKTSATSSTSTSTSSTSSTTSTTSSTSFTTSTTSTTATSSTTTTSTSTTETTTTSITTITTTTTTTTTTTPGNGISWGLIAGILSAALPLTLCACCCLYRLLWSPSARQRQHKEEEEEEEDQRKYNHLTTSTESMARTTKPDNDENVQIEVPKKSYTVYNIHSQQNNVNNLTSPTECEGSILVAIYNKTNANRTEEAFEMKENTSMQPSMEGAIHENNPMDQRTTQAHFSANEISNLKSTERNFGENHSKTKQQYMRSRSALLFNTGKVNVFQSSSETTFKTDTDHHFKSNSANFTDWSRLYLFGRKQNIQAPPPPISKPSE